MSPIQADFFRSHFYVCPIVFHWSFYAVFPPSSMDYDEFRKLSDEKVNFYLPIVKTTSLPSIYLQQARKLQDAQAVKLTS